MGKSTDTKAKKQITKPDSVKVNFKKLLKRTRQIQNTGLFLPRSLMKILPPYYGSVFIMRKAPTCKGMRHIDLWRFKSMKSGKPTL